jgi:hypothetical protein
MRFVEERRFSAAFIERSEVRDPEGPLFHEPQLLI